MATIPGQCVSVDKMISTQVGSKDGSPDVITVQPLYVLTINLILVMFASCLTLLTMRLCKPRQPNKDE